MLVVVSPAKKLDMSPVDTEVTSVPKFSDEAHNLAKIASNFRQRWPYFSNEN